MTSTASAKRQKLAATGLGSSSAVSGGGSSDSSSLQRHKLSSRNDIEDKHDNNRKSAVAAAARRQQQSGARRSATSASGRQNGRVQRSSGATGVGGDADDADELSDDTDGDSEVNSDETEEEADSADDDNDDDDDDDEDDDEDDDDDDDDGSVFGARRRPSKCSSKGAKRKSAASAAAAACSSSQLQEQLAASGPAGVAAAAAIATARKRRRPHTFETNPSVRKRQQTRLIRKLRACIDEYTARVGQQAVVLITMPGKTAHNFKVFGAQPLESVVRACKQEIMSELEQAVAEQTPLRLGAHDDSSGKHELPALVIDGIPTPVEKMTQAQLRAFIPLMLKYSTGRGKPGWGKDSTKPQWWPDTLPWANVRSDARDEDEKQRISWTTTLREIVTNCYKFHGREDLLPSFDESEAAAAAAEAAAAASTGDDERAPTSGAQSAAGTKRNSLSQRPLGSATTRSARLQHQHNQLHQIQNHHHHHHNQQHHSQQQQQQTPAQIEYQMYASGPGLQQAYASGAQAQFVHTIQNADGSVSLIQVDPANAQILTLPDGTQVRAVRLQTLADGSGAAAETGDARHHHQLLEGHHHQQEVLVATDQSGGQQQSASQQQHEQQMLAAPSETQTIILTNEDGTQSCYPVSQLVSIPASMYQQFAASGQQLSIVAADGTQLTAAGSIATTDGGEHQQTIQEAREISAAEAESAAAGGGDGGDAEVAASEPSSEQSGAADAQQVSVGDELDQPKLKMETQNGHSAAANPSQDSPTGTKQQASVFEV